MSQETLTRSIGRQHNSPPESTSPIDLAVVSDGRYLEPIGVMLFSILRWHAPESLRLHWVHVRMGRDGRAAAAALCRSAGLRVSFVAADSLVAAAGWPSNVHPTVLKIFLPQILEGLGERLLYLDGDVVVEGPLWPLWQSDLRGAALGGVRDSWVGSPGFWPTVAPPGEASRALWSRPNYINAGVLMYDVARCRALDLAHTCTRWLIDHPHAHFFEQDALNATLAEALVLLHPRWNVLGAAGNYLRGPRAHSGYCADELVDAYRNPQIVHFAGEQKPWREPAHWPALSSRYLQARRLTPWNRRLGAAERLHVAVLDLAYRLQCRRRLRAAGAVLFARRAILSLGRAGRGEASR